MRPQFPGMDPWLEQPTLWPDVHNSLITSIRDELAPRCCRSLFCGRGVTHDGRDRAGHRPSLSTRLSRSTPRNAAGQATGAGRGGARFVPMFKPLEVVVPVGERNRRDLSRDSRAAWPEARVA